jgi:hypothetical protein
MRIRSSSQWMAIEALVLLAALCVVGFSIYKMISVK